ncbi:MAG: hypothetical protein DHS20C09_04680 [marine bacterium B5-7]|nr:MAG: hypothetical protein DHS20C09_04680 [marine bacterium B5-7]
MTINNVSHEIVKKFGRIIGESKNIKRADLYARDVEKGIFNQYEAYAGTTIGRILVTGSLDDAIEWLGHGEYSELIRKQLSSLYGPT